MVSTICSASKRKVVGQLWQAIFLLLVLGCAACDQIEPQLSTPAASATDTASPTAVSTNAVEAISVTATAVPTSTLSPPETATAAPTATPTTIAALPPITQPVRSHQVIWLMRDGKLWRSDVHGVVIDQLGSDDFLGFGDADGLGLASLRLSPDGRWLVNPANQDNKLHILDVGTGQERALPVSVTALAWSPDSRTLAYAPARTYPTSAKPDCALCLYDLATGTHTSLIPNSDAAFESIYELVWSPSSQKLAYGCCFVPREPYEGISDGRLETIQVATGQRSDEGPLIVSVGGGVARFCWRGERIVTTDAVLADHCAATPTDWFNRISRDSLQAGWEAVPDSSDWTATRLYVTNQVTGELVWEHMLETTHALRLGWSPDGGYLFFDDGSSNSPIWRLTADNSELRQISPDGILLGVVNRWESFQPSQIVSPDGRHLFIIQVPNP